MTMHTEYKRQYTAYTLKINDQTRCMYVNKKRSVHGIYKAKNDYALLVYQMYCTLKVTVHCIYTNESAMYTALYNNHYSIL